MDKQDAIVGKIVRRFTDSENILRDIGAIIDSCIVTEGENEFHNLVSEMYIKLCSLQLSLNNYTEDLKKYLNSSDPNVEGDFQ